MSLLLIIIYKNTYNRNNHHNSVSLIVLSNKVRQVGQGKPKRQVRKVKKRLKGKKRKISNLSKTSKCYNLNQYLS